MTKFFAVRYLIIQENQINALDEVYKDKNDLIRNIFMKNPTLEYRKNKYTTRMLTTINSDKWLVGHYLRSTKTHMIEVKERIYEQDLDNWKKVFLGIYFERQIVIFQYKSEFSTPESIRNTFEKFLQGNSNNSNYKIKVELLVNEDTFWSTIRNAHSLYKIGFKLSAPNIFGSTKRANELLKGIQDEHNITDFNFEIENSNGKLAVPKKNEGELESYRSQADDGGGSWHIDYGYNDKREYISSGTDYRTQETSAFDELLDTDELSMMDSSKKRDLTTILFSILNGFIPKESSGKSISDIEER